MTVEHVPGRNAGKIMLYALSTCGWCRKTKQFLDDMGVEYDYEYVDLLQGDERKSAVRKVAGWNPARTFPTIIVNDEKCIIGYNEDELREVLSE